MKKEEYKSRRKVHQAKNRRKGKRGIPEITKIRMSLKRKVPRKG